MSKKIVQLNEEVIKGQIKELVRGSVEETLNGLIILYLYILSLKKPIHSYPIDWASRFMVYRVSLVVDNFFVTPRA